jgi:hypothetical protein
MIPTPGTYRISTPGAPSSDVVVSPDGQTLTTTFDVFDYQPALGVYKARRLSCAIECNGNGTGLSFVGQYPGFPTDITCVRLP